MSDVPNAPAPNSPKPTEPNRPTSAQIVQGPAAPAHFEAEAQKRQAGIARELLAYLRYTKKWWLTPIVVFLVLLSVLVVLSGTAVAPFIYTLF